MIFCKIPNIMQLQNILFYSAILPNIMLFWCRIFVFCLTWKILFRANSILSSLKTKLAEIWYTFNSILGHKSPNNCAKSVHRRLNLTPLLCFSVSLDLQFQNSETATAAPRRPRPTGWAPSSSPACRGCEAAPRPTSSSSSTRVPASVRKTFTMRSSSSGR